MNEREASMHSVLLALALCAAAMIIGWVLMIASLLYVVAEYSATTWFLTALCLASAHVVLALYFWHYAAKLARGLNLRAEISGEERQG